MKPSLIDSILKFVPPTKNNFLARIEFSSLVAFFKLDAFWFSKYDFLILFFISSNNFKLEVKVEYEHSLRIM